MLKRDSDLTKIGQQYTNPSKAKFINRCNMQPSVMYIIFLFVPDINK